MDQASRLRQHDNVQQQISAFEKLLQHAISRFSKEKLYQKLRTLSSALGGFLPDTGRNAVEPTTSGRLSSLRQLRDILDTAASGVFSELGITEERLFLDFFQRFFVDIDYLRQLKKQFDNKIYRCLYEYYYDMELDEATIDDTSSDNTNTDPAKTHIGSSTNAPFDEKSYEEKLEYAIREMHTVNTKWDALFREEPLHMDSFDQDSYHEIVQFSHCSQFEPLLRLVPDIFVRAYKSIELAKTWWTAANNVYGFLPRQQAANASEYQIAVDQLVSDIAELSEEIRRQESLMASLKQDMLMLKKRENRCIVLGGEYDKIEERKNRAYEHYNVLLERRRRLIERLESLDEDTSTYRSTQMDVRKLDDKLTVARQQQEQLSFQFEIVKQDFCLELELRPEFIRYVADVKGKMTEAEDAVSDARHRKKANEKRLALMRTNSERMRHIMTKHVHVAVCDNYVSQKKEHDGALVHNGRSIALPRGQIRREFDDFENTHAVSSHTADLPPLCIPTKHERREDSSSSSCVSISSDVNWDNTSRSSQDNLNKHLRETMDASKPHPTPDKHYSPAPKPAIASRKRIKRNRQAKRPLASCEISYKESWSQEGSTV